MPEQNSIGEKMSNFIFSLDEYAQMRAWAPFERDSQLQVERGASLTSSSYSVFLELKKKWTWGHLRTLLLSINLMFSFYPDFVQSITTIKIGGSLKSLISPPTWKGSLQISGALSLISKLIGSSAEEMGRGGSTEHSRKIILENVFYSHRNQKSEINRKRLLSRREQWS